jgi:hypothetical protein
LYSSPNFISVITSRRMRWAGDGAGIGENRYEYMAVKIKSEII